MCFGQPRQIYEKYLFKYEKVNNPKTSFKLNLQKDKVDLTDVNPSLMREVKVFEIKTKDDLTKEVIRQILSEEVAIVRGFCWAFGISKSEFDTDLLRKQHGETKVDIVE